MTLKECIEDAIWVAHALFNRNKVSGSSANMSFLYEGRIYITRSGSCFGNLSAQDFSVMSLSGECIEGEKPSKEYPMHQAVYQYKPLTKAVIHTHSFYSVLWSCKNHENKSEAIPKFTPYLEMKVGKIGIVPYAPPGSDTLFQLFRDALPHSEGFLLRNHGPVVGGTSILEAFYALEELEESAKIAWHISVAREADLEFEGIE